MKLTENDIGKYFKTSHGRKYFFAGMDRHEPYCCVFSCSIDGDILRVNRDGEVRAGQHHWSNITAPWPETNTIKGWAVLYKSTTDQFFVMQSEIFPTKEAAQSVWDKANYRFVEITYTEGEGLK